MSGNVRDLETLAREEPEAVKAVADRAGDELEEMLLSVLEGVGNAEPADDE